MAQTRVSIEEKEVKPDQDGLYLSDYLFLNFSSLNTKNAAKKAIKRQRVLLLDKIEENTGYRVQTGDRIILLENIEEAPATEFNLKLDVIHESKTFLVVNKPAGIEVSGKRIKTIENVLAGQVKMPEHDPLPKPKAVHRLDYPTTGLLLVALSPSSLQKLSDQFQNRTVEKKYQAIVHGECPETGSIEINLDGRESITHYRRLESVPSVKNGKLSLVEITPETGRLHQIRRHFQSIGHCLVGDQKYPNPKGTFTGKSLMLCATQLCFHDPDLDRKIELKIEAPPKFRSLLDREARRYHRHH